LDDLSSVIFLNRTKATLNCGAGSMQVELKFNDHFYGIAYADFDRSSACQVVGKGGISYNLELPLKGCGTKQVGWKQSFGLVSLKVLRDIVRILLGFLRGHYEYLFGSFGDILSFRLLGGGGRGFVVGILCRFLQVVRGHGELVVGFFGITVSTCYGYPGTL
jgi:hypothetical protein